MDRRTIVTGGTLLDPAKGRAVQEDLYLLGGRIVAGPGHRKASEAWAGAETIDASGCLVVPGLVDFHAHVADTIISLAVPPDQAGTAVGAVAVCDAGSCGWLNFEAFHRFIVPKAAARIYALLHIGPFGEAVLPEIGYELYDEARILEVIEAYRDCIRGIKLRLIGEVMAEERLDVPACAFRTARKADLPVVVHTGFTETCGLSAKTILYQQERLLGMMEAGDVITHAFTARTGGMFTHNTALRSALRAAVGRGVLLDVAPGRGHMSFSIARRALDEGFLPDLLGTDTVRTPEPHPHFYSPTMVMSKLIALGLPREHVLSMASSRPAAVLKAEHEIGSLDIGMPANLTLLEEAEGDFLLVDGAGLQTVAAEAILVPVLTVRNGEPLQISPAIRNHRPDREAMLAAIARARS